MPNFNMDIGPSLSDLMTQKAVQQAQIGAMGQESQLRNLQMQGAQQDFNDKSQLRSLMSQIPANGDMSSIMPQLAKLGPSGVDTAVKMMQAKSQLEQIARQNAIRKQIADATQGGGMVGTDGAAGQPGGLNGYRQKMAMVYMQNGDPDTAMKYMPKVKDWKEVQTANGVQYAPLFEDGGFGAPVPMNVAKQLHFADTGGRAGVGLDAYTGAPVTAGFQKTLDPGQVLSANTTMRGQNMADARAKQTLDQANTHFNITNAGGKPLTEVQGNAALFGARAEEADKILTSLEGKYSRAAVATKKGAEDVWGVGGVLGAAANSMISPADQKVDQAQRDFVNAVLRKESGAAIAQSEFNNAIKQYFPNVGDSKATVAQKARNRQTAIIGMKNMAGRGAFTAPEIQAGSGDIHAQADAILNGGK